MVAALKYCLCFPGHANYNLQQSTLGFSSMKSEMQSSLSTLERPATMCESFSRWAEIKPQHVAIEFLPDRGEPVRVTYGQMHRQTLAIRDLLRGECQIGDRVILMLPAGPEFVVGFLGCLYAGMIAVPASEPKPKRRNDRLSSVAGDCVPTAVLCTRAIRDRIDPNLVCPELATVPWVCLEDASDSPHDPTRRNGVESRDRLSSPGLKPIGRVTDEGFLDPIDTGRLADTLPSPGSVAFLQYTSGSTSDPMGVAVTHHNLIHNLEMIRLGFGLDFNEANLPSLKGVFWLPPYHDMGLIGAILEPLYLGGTTVLMPPTSFLKKPLRWLQAISDFQAVISGAPNFAYELCVNRVTLAGRESLDLSRWEVAFCGAEPIRAETIDRFCETFAPSGFRRTSFYPCYGLAEATLLVSGHQAGSEPVIKTIRRGEMERFVVSECDDSPDQDMPGHDAEETLRVIGCGHPRLDGEILIIDPETGRPVAADQIGEIWYRGENVAGGYWNRPEKTAAVFDARPVGRPDDAFLRTGDMGFWDGNQLFVTGRLKEMLVIRGRNLFPQDLEATARSIDADSIDGVVIFPLGGDSDESLVLVVEVDRRSDAATSETLSSKIRAALNETFDVSLSAVLFVRPFSLPRTTSGKMQRWLTRQLFTEGSLKVIHRWDRSPAVADSPSQPTPKPAVATNSVSPARPAPAPARPAPTTASSRRSNQASNERAKERSGAEPFDPGLNDSRLAHVAEEIESWLCTRLQTHGHLAPEEVTPDRPLAEFGLDSMTTLQLAGEIEDHYRVTLNPIVMWNYPTARHLALYLAEQIMGEFTENCPADVQPSDGHRSFETLLDEVERMDDQEVLRQLHIH